MIQDFRYALRFFWQRPWFAIVSILVIGIGIGANAAIFSVVDGVLLRPLPYKDPGRLVFIRADFQGETGLPGLAPGEIADLRSQSKLIEQIGWIVLPGASLTSGQMEHVTAVTASDDFLPVLGVNPALGRVLISKEDQGSPRLRNLMISYELWQRRYQGDPNVIGRPLEVNNFTATIIGVLPQGFRVYLGADTNVPPQIDVWFPGDPEEGSSRSYHYQQTVARLRQGVTLQQAQEEIDAIASRMVERNPKSYSGRSFRLHLMGLRQDLVKPVRPAILVLLAAVGFVLFIACANVANLLLARASGRKSEIAIRTALGAGRTRVIRQMLTESLVLALAGGVAGLLLAEQGIHLLLYLKPENLPRQEGISLSATVTAFTLGLSLLSGILFGLAPAWHAAKMDIHSALKEAGRSKASGTGGKRIRVTLVMAQVALSLVLLIGAGLMIRTFENMRRIDLGFDPANLLTLRVDYNRSLLNGADSRRFYKRVVDAVQSQPGVESVTAATSLPFDPTSWTDSVAVEDNPEVIRTALYNPTLPDYFRTLRIPLAAGRDFTEKDNIDAAPVAIVDQNFAARTWPGQNPIGKKIIVHPQSKTDRKAVEIVGIARTTRPGIRPDERPQVYVPYGSDDGFKLTVTVRTHADAAIMGPLLRQTIEGIGGHRPVWDIRTMNEYIAIAMAETRFALVLLGILSAVAFVLSVVGVYGVVAYSMAERMQEFAIRLALGARARDIFTLAFASGVAPAIGGIGIGILGSLGLTRFLSRLLFGVSTTDAMTYVVISSLVFLAALAACYVPVRRCSRVDPKEYLQ